MEVVVFKNLLETVDNLVAYRCNNAENISTIIIAREDDVLAVVNGI